MATATGTEEVEVSGRVVAEKEGNSYENEEEKGLGKEDGNITF